jgi:flagellum-specific peptidoglycan hydrolase FlgJ
LVMAEATKKTRENLGAAITQNKDVGKSFAYSLEALQNEAKYRDKSPGDIKKMIEEEREVRAKALKEGTTDPAKAARNAQEQAERRTRLGADAIVSVLNGPVTNAFEKLMKVMGGLAKGIAHFAKWLGGPDFTGMFETTEDVAEKQHQNALALDKTLTEIEKAKLAAADPEKYKQNLEDQRKLADEEVKTKMNLFRDLKKQASEEKDIAKKALLEKQADEAGKEVGEANRKKLQADIDAQNVRNRTDDRIKKEAQEKLLSLEKKKIDLTTQENKLDEEQIKKQLEQGTITPKEAEEKRNYKTTVTKEQGQIAASQAELAGNQSASESKRLGLSKGAQESATPLQGNSKEFYNKMYSTLLEEAKKAKIANPEAVARLGASQSALETGYGKHTAGGNNYFGIKASKSNSGNAVSTQEFDPKTGKMVTIKDSFRKYDTMEESAADYIKFLQENKRYKGVLASQNVEEAILAQGKTGYATDPNYVNKLSLIDKRGQADVAKSQNQPNVAQVPNQPDVSKLPNQAAEGGIFSGPNTGYPVAMHGNELVAPLDPNSIIAKMLTSTPDQIMQMANQNTATTNSTPENNGLTLEVFTMLAEKLDTMINILNTSNDTQEELLKYSRV